jgi:hypothetical protein
MRKSNDSFVQLCSIFAACLFGILSLSTPTYAADDIEKFVVPPTLHHLEATLTHSQANFDVLKKISPGFADGYRVDKGTYIYDAPEKLTIEAHAGIISATQTYTNKTRRTDFGFIHRTDDISGDITRRQTIASLGLLPQNYLDIMQSQYVGQETVDGEKCDIYMLRFKTDPPTGNRRFETWVSIDKHYIVKQRVWSGDNTEHQTVLYKNPKQIMVGIWIPTRVEAYDSAGELGGVANQDNISAY